MVSKKLLQDINDYFDKGYIHPALIYTHTYGFKLDLSKLNYKKKVIPVSAFDTYFNNLMNKLTIKDNN